MTREEQIQKAADEYAERGGNLLEYSDNWQEYNDYEYVKKAFIAGANWADKHPDVNFVFLTGFEAAQEDIISKLQSLIKEWSHNDSSEGKYRLEAYKELLESIKQ